MDEDFIIFKRAVQLDKIGGRGSGNFGHAGQGNGEVGGSGEGGDKVTIRNSPDLKEGIKKDDKWIGQDGNPIKAPPQWKNVKYNPDPKGDIQLIGDDSKGRLQVKYSALHDEKAAIAKFNRIDELDKNINLISKEIKSDIKNGSEEARVLSLIKDTGIRPGSENDTGAEKQAYGATTLQGKHIFVDKDGEVTLKFVGKKGVDLKIPVGDMNVRDYLIERKNSIGNKDKVFNTDTKKLLEYSNNRDGGGFLTKDFRTWVGTTTAKETMSKYDDPVNAKQKKSFIKKIATEVSDKLGNTPVVALQKYIDPRIFLKWSKI
jgi:DNA topoisomerase-1